MGRRRPSTPPAHPAVRRDRTLAEPPNQRPWPALRSREAPPSICGSGGCRGSAPAMRPPRTGTNPSLVEASRSCAAFHPVMHHHERNGPHARKARIERGLAAIAPRAPLGTRSHSRVLPLPMIHWISLDNDALVALRSAATCVARKDDSGGISPSRAPWCSYSIAAARSTLLADRVYTELKSDAPFQPWRSRSDRL